MEFTSQEQDEINGNDFVKRSLGPAATRRHKQFCRFFSTQCPVKPSATFSCKTNWKLEPFLEWIKSVSQKAWKLGEEISVYKQTCGFQGQHQCKLRIIYKNEGEGFQCDALCDNGYTFTFYFRHEPPPEKYTKQVLLPLHAHVMYLFDSCDIMNIIYAELTTYTCPLNFAEML